ncbi:MAG TPA: carbohydrate ABC transporter permease [Candidatus Eisenbacteria bacterium]
MSSRMVGARDRGHWLIVGLLSLGLVTMLLPLWWMIGTSLKAVGAGLGGLQDLFPWPLSLKNYRDILASGPFGRYFLNSAIVAVVVVAGNVLFSAMVGYAFARRKFPCKGPLWLGLLATLMVPKQVTMIPVYVLAAKLRLVDTYVALIAPFLVDAFNVFLMRSYIEQLPDDLEEAARVDGASEWRIFFRVVFPLTRPALAVVGINTFLVNWNNFLYPLILTSSDKMRTLPVGLALYAQGENSVSWGHLMAGSCLSTLPILAVFVIFQRHIIEGITAGAGK